MAHDLVYYVSSNVGANLSGPAGTVPRQGLNVTQVFPLMGVAEY
ncbi:hypothetical protein [Pontibacter diazotrophicus]|nr:hypothetical protein [Pontibacter diazotrophicus]